MPLTYAHDIGDELVSYLTNKFHRWNLTLETENGSERLRVQLKDGDEASPEEFLPVKFARGHVHNRAEVTEQILVDEDDDLTYPFLLVKPLPMEPLDDEITYTDHDYEYDENNEEVTVKKGKRRVSFNFQIEGVTDNWADYNLIKTLLDYRLFERDRAQDYVSLFGNTYTVEYDSPQETIQEQQDLFRYIAVIGIEMNIYTLPEEVIESIEETIVNTELLNS